MFVAPPVTKSTSTAVDGGCGGGRRPKLPGHVPSPADADGAVGGGDDGAVDGGTAALFAFHRGQYSGDADLRDAAAGPPRAAPAAGRPASGHAAVVLRVRAASLRRLQRHAHPSVTVFVAAAEFLRRPNGRRQRSGPPSGHFYTAEYAARRAARVSSAIRFTTSSASAARYRTSRAVAAAATPKRRIRGPAYARSSNSTVYAPND